MGGSVSPENVKDSDGRRDSSRSRSAEMKIKDIVYQNEKLEQP